MSKQVRTVVFAIVMSLLSMPIQALDVQRFLDKHKHGCPPWAKEQIDEDLKPFNTKGITQAALNLTLDRCIRRNQNHPAPHEHFVRYRILNNNIYRKNYDIWLDYFDRVLIQLANTIRLPDVDFILCISDGVPVHTQDPTYWIADEFNEQAPVFVRARKKGLEYLPLLPDYSAFDLSWVIRDVVAANQKYPWHSKIKKAFWRGSGSDRPVPCSVNDSLCEISPRLSLSFLSVLFPDQIDAGYVNTRPFTGFDVPGLLQRRFPNDQAYYGQYLTKDHRSISDHIAYAYLPCLDGIVCTYPGYYWRLLSNSVVLKADSDFELWFYKLLKPYQHYLPMAADCGDILQVIDWANSHEKECLFIVNNANRVVVDHLSEEDNFLYVLEALRAYQKCQRFNMQALWDSTYNSPEWKLVGMGQLPHMLKAGY